MIEDDDFDEEWSVDDNYEANKDARVGTPIICPVCKKEFVKIQYSQAFCSRTCKDEYWNAKPGRRWQDRLAAMRRKYRNY